VFGDTLLPPKQKEELFSLVSTGSGQPIAAVSAKDRQVFSMGIDQVWATFLANPIVWTYTGPSPLNDIRARSSLPAEVPGKE
jgi:hypothetical protein